MNRFLVPIAALLGPSVAATGAIAESLVSAYSNGKKIEVVSDQSNSSIRASNEGAIIRSGDFVFRVTAETLTFGGHSFELGTFSAIEIMIVGNKVQVSVDGVPLSDLKQDLRLSQ